MYSWQKFNETPMPDKKGFYSNLTMEDITDADYKHTERVWENCRIQNLGEYHDLYVQSDSLLVADVFKNSHNKCIEIYELDLGYILSVLG